MKTNLFSYSRDYLESIDGLRRLHALSAQGLNDSDEADAVRDDLDFPWYRLTDVERKRIRGLSADLYTISDPPVVPKEMNSQARQKLSEAIQARDKGDWDRALELLRRWSAYIDPSHLSYIRGSVWLSLDDFPTATLFFEHAAKLNPENVDLTFPTKAR